MKPEIVASECCAGRFPQNTLRGFEYCLAAGFDGIEFDVHLSRDGHVVVQHDYLLNKRITRGPSGEWLAHKGPPICQLSLQELKGFDVGRYAPDSREARSYPHYQPLDGEKIPTLAELLRAYREAGSSADLWLELKTTPFDRDISSAPDKLLNAVLSLVSEYGLVSNTILLAFEWRLLIDARAIRPEIRTDFLTINPSYVTNLYKGKGFVRPADMYAPLDPARYHNNLPATIAAADGQWWGPYVEDVSAQDIEQAQAAGLRVNVWGVASDQQALQRAVRLGADAITVSDAPMLQQLLTVSEPGQP